MTLVLDDLSKWKLDPLVAVSPQLRLILRSRIIRNDLKPASRLSEPELAREYHVSRQPVREAFITLMNEGLLEIRPQRGTFVKLIDYDAVLNGRFVREAVEADIVKRLADTPPDGLVKDLRTQLDAQKAVGARDPAKFIELDERFHHTLSDAAGVGKAWSILDAIKTQMDRVRFLTFEEFPVAKLIDQHTAIVDAIEQQHVAGAEVAMRTHLMEILSSLPKVQALYPAYFDGSAQTIPDPKP